MYWEAQQSYYHHGRFILKANTSTVCLSRFSPPAIHPWLQECVLTTLVYFLVAEVPVIKPSGSSSGATGSSGASTGGTGSTGWGQQQGSGGSGGSGGPGGTTGSRGGRQQGMLSSTFERLFLAHLHAYLPHRQYEVARAQESRASLFLTRFLGEVWLDYARFQKLSEWSRSCGGLQWGGSEWNQDAKCHLWPFPVCPTFQPEAVPRVSDRATAPVFSIFGSAVFLRCPAATSCIAQLPLGAPSHHCKPMPAARIWECVVGHWARRFAMEERC